MLTKFKVTIVISFIFFWLLSIEYSYSDEINELIQKLKDRDLSVRMDAAKALGEKKDDRAAEPLMVALKDKKWQVRMEAATALREIGKYPPGLYWLKSEGLVVTTIDYDLVNKLEFNLMFNVVRGKVFVDPSISPKFRSHLFGLTVDIRHNSGGVGYNHYYLIPLFINKYTRCPGDFIGFGLGGRIYYSWDSESHFDKEGLFVNPVLSLIYTLHNGVAIYLDTGPFINFQTGNRSDYTVRVGFLLFGIGMGEGGSY